MKAAVLSNIHGNAGALAAVLAALSSECEVTLFLGNLAGYYPFVEECFGMLRGRGLPGVRGNHDEALLSWIDHGAAPATDYQARYGSALRRCRRALSESAVRWLREAPPARVVRLGVCCGWRTRRRGTRLRGGSTRISRNGRSWTPSPRTLCC